MSYSHCSRHIQIMIIDMFVSVQIDGDSLLNLCDPK